MEGNRREKGVGGGIVGKGGGARSRRTRSATPANMPHKEKRPLGDPTELKNVSTL